MPNNSLLQQLSAERTALADSLVPHTVAIRTHGRRTVSGIRWRGPYLISAAEPLAGIEQVSWRAAGAEPMTGEVVAADLATDIAVIRTQATAANLDTAALKLGETVAIAGRDERGALLRWGSVSLCGSAWRSRRGGQIAQRIEFDAALDERFEGALVANTAGQVVAMQVMGPHGRALGIPAETIERVLRTVEQHGYLPRPYLGLRLQTLWLDAATAARLGRRAAQIAIITGVDADSPAARAGLAFGDLIEAIDGQQIDGVEGVTRTLSATAVGSALAFGVRRGDMPDTRELTVTERPRAAH